MPAKIYVAERAANTISVWSGDAPQTWLEDLFPRKANYLGAVEPSLRRWLKFAGVTRDQILAETCVAPEGLALCDGYLYWGSMAQAQVRRLNLVTRQVEIAVGEVPFIVGDVVGQTHFVHVTVSDGTWGPRSMLLTATADNQTLGRPIAWLPVPGSVTPSGTSFGAIPVTHSKRWSWAGYCPHATRGNAAWSDSVYPFASSIGNGMLATGGSNIGLDVYVKSVFGEALTDEARIARGRRYYTGNGYDIIHGNFGWGYLDLPLPWGENTDCDYFLEKNGHVRP